MIEEGRAAPRLTVEMAAQYAKASNESIVAQHGVSHSAQLIEWKQCARLNTEGLQVALATPKKACAKHTQISPCATKVARTSG